jgi:NADH:ubiquinone oxidoreductase subunit 6 (subunit J)
MLENIPLILIILPLLFQIIAGRKAIGETISLKFGTVCLISLIAQIIVPVLSFYIATYNANKYTEQNPNSLKCGMEFVGLFMLAFLFSFILIVTIIIQYCIKRSYEK